MLHIIISATSSSKKIYCIIYLTARQEERDRKKKKKLSATCTASRPLSIDNSKPRTNSNHVKLMSFSEFLAPHADVLILGLQPCDKVVTLAISRIFLVLRGERHFSSWPQLLGAAAIGRGFDFQFWTITQDPAQGLKITEKCTYVQKCTQRRKRWVWQKFVGGLMRLARTFARGLAKIQLLKLHVDHYCFFLLFKFSTKIWNFTCLNHSRGFLFAGV